MTRTRRGSQLGDSRYPSSHHDYHGERQSVRLASLSVSVGFLFVLLVFCYFCWFVFLFYVMNDYFGCSFCLFCGCQQRFGEANQGYFSSVLVRLTTLSLFLERKYICLQQLTGGPASTTVLSASGHKPRARYVSDQSNMQHVDRFGTIFYALCIFVRFR